MNRLKRSKIQKIREDIRGNNVRVVDLRMVGSGYLAGLSDGEILLEARILGLADIVEAMSSHRHYQVARGIDKALEEILQNRGVLYDPNAVDTCLKLFTEKGFRF